VYYPLKRRDLENFLDYQTAVDRVRNIAASEETSNEGRELAARLLIAFEQGADR
jgi:hypothetical protein